MAATRLSDSQKTELVGRFREGFSSQQLANSYGCSANTVIRVVRTELGEAEYERLKAERSRRRSRTATGDADPAVAPEALQTALAISTPEPEHAPEPEAPHEPDPEPEAPAEPEAALEPAPEATTTPRRTIPAPPRRLTVSAPARAEAVAEDGPAVLAIEDADDFGADDDDLLTSDDSDDEGSDDGTDGSINPFQPIPVVLLDDGAPAGADGRLQPLASAALPSSAYMLVDKTVELQARPLSEFPELGRLPAAELERQALVVFLNPRQAKRQCGRTQRVIKLPDLKVFELTAPYLLAQGISRVVIEGSLYALPGS
ncbi:hypothetical protein VB738_09120 [Cyanobium gracile UHCC 0139]|uniref:Helix-turn-helix domain containing protein n=1 Tax=Cyanobium gracile UHCC 0139 TaxID=3110308 RepID=A0ABU5RUI1_9CYAN|nr:hypothetical protein [Cyanobium gracile]MEA5391418.1 hypothetical protein [Cyanobium gracile UHCC 0139]